MKPVRIVSPGADKNGSAQAMGTQVFMGDTAIEGINSITVTYIPGEHIRAKIGLIGVQVNDQAAEAEFTMTDPLTGEKKTVKKIEFTDGNVRSL